MSFLAPLFLLGSLLAALPYLLHLRSRDISDVQPFSAVRFLKATPLAEERRRRPHDLWLLVLRMLVVLFLAGAFARPHLRGAASVAGDAIVALDSSFSMGPSARFDAARESARAWVRGLPAATRVAFIEFNRDADVRVPLTADRAAVLAAIDAARLQPRATSYAAMLASAEAVLDRRRDSPQERLAVFTDRQRTGWADARASLGPHVALEVFASPPVANVAVTDVTEGERQLEAVVQAWGGEARRVSVTLKRAGTADVAKDLVATPGSRAVVTFDLGEAASGSATVEVADPAGPVEDNARHVVLGPPDRGRVLVVDAGAASRSKGGLYVAEALAAMGAVNVDRMDVADFERLPLDRVTGADVVWLLSTRPLGRAGRDRVAAVLAAGHAVVLTVGPDVEDAVLAGLPGEPRLDFAARADPPGVVALVADDWRHPLFAGVLAEGIGRVRLERGYAVRPGAWRVLARFSNGDVAMMERGRLLFLGFDVSGGWSDVVRLPIFVPLIVETNAYACQCADAANALVGDAPRRLTTEPGVRKDGHSRSVAVNVDAAESDVTPATEAEFVAAVSRVARPAAPLQASQPAGSLDTLWRTALMAVLLLLVGETLVAARRPRGHPSV